MPTTDLTAGIVRILKPGGSTAGTGFVVTYDGFIATCAHVVKNAGAGPGGTVRVVFHATEEEREARGEPEWWRAPDAEDVAILCLERALPEGVQTLPLDRPDQSKGHRFETFGFPPISKEGMWGSGQILGMLTIQGASMIQLRSQEVTTGFSGAPVWDQDIRQVIGMVSAITPPDQYGRQRETVFAISTEMLAQVCPRLRCALPPPSVSVEPAAARPELQAGAQLDLQGKSYLVREVIAQKAFGTLVVRTARASDLTMSRGVGIRQVEALTDTPEDQASMHRIANHARTLGQVASRCGHVPQVYDVIDQDEGTVWAIVEWVRGTLVDKLLPQEGPLPDAPALLQLLHWATDVCEALSALHRRRVSHGGVGSRTIIITQGRRGSVLIAPGFVASPGPLAAEPPPFDPAGDVRDLAAMIYKLATHHPAQTTPVSVFNPFVPPNLDEVLQEALSGSVRRADHFKRSLHQVKQVLRT